jgi:hypothetical protein
VEGGTARGGVWHGGRLAGSDPGTAFVGGRWRQCAARARAHGQGRWEAASWGPDTVTVVMWSNVFELI